MCIYIYIHCFFFVKSSNYNLITYNTYPLNGLKSGVNAATLNAMLFQVQQIKSWSDKNQLDRTGRRGMASHWFRGSLCNFWFLAKPLRLHITTATWLEGTGWRRRPGACQPQHILPSIISDPPPPPPTDCAVSHLYFGERSRFYILKNITGART